MFEHTPGNVFNMTFPKMYLLCEDMRKAVVVSQSDMKRRIEVTYRNV